MKKIITTIAFLLGFNAIYSQTDTTKPVIHPEVHVFLYAGEIERDTIANVEFTYIKNGNVKYDKGCLVEVNQLWTTEPGGNTVVEKKPIEYYIIAQNSIRYELSSVGFNGQTLNSNTNYPNGLLKCLKQQPRFVWEIKQ